MVNNQNIQINFYGGNKSIKIKLPPKTYFLEKSLKLINKLYNVDGENESEGKYYDEYRYPSRISKGLLENKKFRKIFDRAVEEYNDWYFRQCKFSNITVVTSKKGKLTTQQTLNRQKWKKLFSSAFYDINKNNIEFIIIHVASSISNEEKNRIIDNFSQLFFNVPIIKYVSERKYKSTLVEIFFFGSEVEKYQDYEF